MCGRFSQALPAELMVRLFGAVDLRREAPAPSWNVAPTASGTVAAWDGERERRVLVPLTWGLLAPWEKHWDTAKLWPINARCQTVATSKMFAGRSGSSAGWWSWTAGMSGPGEMARRLRTRWRGPMVLQRCWVASGSAGAVRSGIGC